MAPDSKKIYVNLKHYFLNSSIKLYIVPSIRIASSKIVFHNVKFHG